jgi:fluoroquinolone resistance protein
MDQVYIEDKTFKNYDFTKTPLVKGEYEKCVFKDCSFSETDLSEYRFGDCEFIGCNLSLVKLIKTVFCDVKFTDCKMLGLHFDKCSDFGLSFLFNNCILNYSSFYKTKIKKTVFKNSQLQEADFTECDMTGSVFDNCDLSRAAFAGTNLEKVDFRTALNYSIDPEINRIKKAKFSFPGVTGLLDKYDIVIEADQ